MDLAGGVIIFFGALAVWALILIADVRRRSYWPSVLYGVGLMLVLNLRYLTDGAPNSIAFFIGIYDVLDNLGLSANDEAGAMATCADNACSAWDRYTRHPSWGVAFYERFAEGSQGRTNLLLGHIVGNSVSFALLHWQLFRTGDGPHSAAHRMMGRITMAALAVGVLCAVVLAAEHGPVTEYGGNLSMTGFWFMSICVAVPAVMGVLAIRRGDTEGHRVWMIRLAGAMWGSFWLFRVMLFVLDPLFRNIETVAILTCIWASAPLGILAAEVIMRRSGRGLFTADRTGVGADSDTDADGMTETVEPVAAG